MLEAAAVWVVANASLLQDVCIVLGAVRWWARVKRLVPRVVFGGKWPGLPAVDLLWSVSVAVWFPRCRRWARVVLLCLSLSCCVEGVRAAVCPLVPVRLAGSVSALVPRGRASGAWRAEALLFERWWWRLPACAPPLGRRESEVQRPLASVVAVCRIAGVAWCCAR